MKWKVRKSNLTGTIAIPPSKSHSIRAILAACFCRGKSTIRRPLLSGDGRSAVNIAKSLGVQVYEENEVISVDSTHIFSSDNDTLCDCGNSGTSIRLFTAAAAQENKTFRFDGDKSLRKRPMKPLLEALKDLGADYTLLSDSGDIPFSITGPLRGGFTEIDGITSQYLSSLLLTAPQLPENTTIKVQNLHERPYVELTLWWLDKLGITYAVDKAFTVFTIPGNQTFTPIDLSIPGDFSSATFSAIAAALTGGPITLTGLDFSDPQGDKGIFEYLEKMGVSVIQGSNGVTVSRSKPLTPLTLDLNAMPDSLPAFAVLCTALDRKVHIVNVAQARIKETDRIAIMTEELKKMGGDIAETHDGLTIGPSKLHGAVVNGHDDHRIVMALAIAGFIAEGETIIDTAESAEVTYPGFVEDFQSLGADISIQKQ